MKKNIDMKKNLLDFYMERYEGVVKEKKLKALMEHVTVVSDITGIFTTMLGIFDHKQKRKIHCAVLLHDIGKFNEEGKKSKDDNKNDNHHKKGAEFVRDKSEEIKSLGFTEEEIDDIKLMVRFHMGDYKMEMREKKNLMIMLEILRMSDKLSKFHKIYNGNDKSGDIEKKIMKIEKELRDTSDTRVRNIGRFLFGYFYENMGVYEMLQGVNPKEIDKDTEDILV